jgi:hypothetical protein
MTSSCREDSFSSDNFRCCVCHFNSLLVCDTFRWIGVDKCETHPPVDPLMWETEVSKYRDWSTLETISFDSVAYLMLTALGFLKPESGKQFQVGQSATVWPCQPLLSVRIWMSRVLESNLCPLAYLGEAFKYLCKWNRNKSNTAGPVPDLNLAADRSRCRLFSPVFAFSTFVSPVCRLQWTSSVFEKCRGVSRPYSSVVCTCMDTCDQLLMARRLGPTEPPVQWVPEVKRPVRESDHTTCI